MKTLDKKHAKIGTKVIFNNDSYLIYRATTASVYIGKASLEDIALSIKQDGIKKTFRAFKVEKVKYRQLKFDEKQKVSEFIMPTKVESGMRNFKKCCIDYFNSRIRRAEKKETLGSIYGCRCTKQFFPLIYKDGKLVFSHDGKQYQYDEVKVSNYEK
jgi:hypothetical protein